MEFLKRQVTLLGESPCKAIQDKKILIIGLGGVGGATCEALARCGFGTLFLWDGDVFDLTNLNRQILATRDVVGEKKALVAKDRVKAITPYTQVITNDTFYTKEKNQIILDFAPDFIVDAIDMMSHKLDLITFAYQNNIPIISSMGAGNKVDPFSFRLNTIEETSGSGCPFARIVRKELKKRGVENIPVVHSLAKVHSKNIIANNGRHSPGSISFVPPISGFLMAGYIVNQILDSLEDSLKDTPVL